MGTISVGNSALYYEVFGEGPPVVLVHGVGGNHASWFAQIRAFSQRHKLVTFDQRGFGNSTDAEQRGRSAMADDLFALLDALGLDRVTLVAQSMGGGACVSVTCRHPERVRALVLADTLMGLKLPSDLDAKMTEVQVSTAKLTQLERVLGRTTREREPDKAILYSQIVSFNAVNLASLKGSFELHTLSRLAATAVPVLFVVGEEDILAPPPLVRAVHELLPNSTFHLVADVGHSAHFENPAAFNAAVLQFLQDLP